MIRRLLLIAFPLLLAVFLWVENFHPVGHPVNLSHFAQNQLWVEPEAGREPLLNAIHHAQKEVDVVMYLFTDRQIAYALAEAAQRGVHVRVLLEKSPYGYKNVNNWLTHAWHGNSIQWHWVPWPSSRLNYYHEKSVLIDHQQLWIMTMNFVKSSFSKRYLERNFILEDQDPNDVEQAMVVFNQDWGQNFSIPLNDKSHVVVSPVNIRSALLSLIGNAKDHIQIYAEDFSDYAVLRSIEMASARGVHVQVLYSTPLHPQVAFYLKKYAVQFKKTEHFYNHAKVIIVDAQKFYLGSANFTKNSLGGNRELGVVEADKAIANQLQQYFVQDWQNAG